MSGSLCQGPGTGLPPPISTSVLSTPRAAAARLAALGPVGPPLTAELRSAGSQLRLRGTRNLHRSRRFPMVASARGAVAGRAAGARSDLAHCRLVAAGLRSVQSCFALPSSWAARPVVDRRCGAPSGSTDGLSLCKSAAQPQNQARESPTIIHGASHFPGTAGFALSQAETRSERNPRPRRGSLSPFRRLAIRGSLSPRSTLCPMPTRDTAWPQARPRRRSRDRFDAASGALLAIAIARRDSLIGRSGGPQHPVAFALDEPYAAISGSTSRAKCCSDCRTASASLSSDAGTMISRSMRQARTGASRSGPTAT